MTKKTTAITLSIFIAIMPFLGFPTPFKTSFYVGAGLLLAVLIELISIQGRKRNSGHNENILINNIKIEEQTKTNIEKETEEG